MSKLKDSARQYRREAIERRIQGLDKAVKWANEYLETGAHADWSAFRPLFVQKFQGDQPCPPHPDWVKNVFIKRCEKQIAKNMKLLKRLEH